MEVTGDAIRIDADEIRCIIPSYNGENSHILQSAASIGVEKLYDYVLNKRKSAIIDGTLAIDFTKVANNLERSLF